ncbi:MAG: 1-acyl-sn-glycerol-3-phosphate acyltransferase [Clostridiales bacterium]|nr:1-acyl-sn-glycerol-3-phosphate acyltransferase [Clostridiales bacterium]
MKKELTPREWHAKYKKTMGWIGRRLCPAYFFGNEIPSDTKFIVGNHLQFFDPIFYITHMDSYMRFVTKKETGKMPLISRWLKDLGGIPIDREKSGGDLVAVKAILRAIKNGEDVMIFPEGTRNKTGTTDIQPLKEGTALFAIKTGAMVLPIMIYKKHKAFRRNYLYVGKPFDFADFKGRKLDSEALAEANQILYDKMVEAKAFMDAYMADNGAKKLKKLYKQQKKIQKKKSFVIKID